MTKKHFILAASMVKAILNDEWTHEPPDWAVRHLVHTECTENYTRAVQTAEAFILLFRGFNPRFDENRFLIACGLADKPTKKGQ